MKIEFGSVSDEPFEVQTKYMSSHTIPIGGVSYTFSFVVIRVDTTNNVTSKPVYNFTEFSYSPVKKEVKEGEEAEEVKPTTLDEQFVESIKSLLQLSISEHLAKNPLQRGFKDK